VAEQDGLILTIDCGTQSVRVSLVDRAGNFLAFEKESYTPYQAKHPGWAEQHPSVYWKASCNACLRTQKKEPAYWKRIRGVVVCALRDTGVFLDENRNVLRPCILWMDQRKARCEKPLPWPYRVAFSFVGMNRPIAHTRKHSKTNWVQENEPQTWEKTRHFVQVSGYLNFQLTSRLADSVAAQIAHHPFNYRKQQWTTNPLSWHWPVFGIDRSRLIPLVSAGEVLGEVTRQASEQTGIAQGTPVFAGGSDKGCETIGCGCLDERSVSLSFGTTATIQTTSSRYYEPLRFFPPYPALIPGHYNPEVEIFRGYWMIHWFKKEFAHKEVFRANELGLPPEVVLNRMLEKVPPGCDGLILQPFWGPHIKSPEAKGAIIGFWDIHTRAHVYRAIIEGINYALLEGLYQIRAKSKVAVEQVSVSGGGAQSDTICQITADMFGLPVQRSHTVETSSLGAAMLGYVACGVYDSFPQAAEHMIQPGQTFHPSEKNHRVYRKLYREVYRSIFPRLRKLYLAIEETKNLERTDQNDFHRDDRNP